MPSRSLKELREEAAARRGKLRQTLERIETRKAAASERRRTAPAVTQKRMIKAGAENETPAQQESALERRLRESGA